MSDYVKIGVVSSVDIDTGLVRVIFPDMDGVVSPPLALLTSGSGDALTNRMPEVEDNVVCVFPNPENSLQDGVCLGCLYDGSYDMPADPTTEQGIYFADDSYIAVDKETSTLDVNMIGDFNINAKNVNITAETLTINADSVIINAQSVIITSSNVNFEVPSVRFGGNIVYKGDIQKESDG